MIAEPQIKTLQPYHRLRLLALYSEGKVLAFGFSLPELYQKAKEIMPDLDSHYYLVYPIFPRLVYSRY